MNGTVTDTEIEKLQLDMQGDVLTEGHSGYDSARKVFNAMFDRRPRVIARCANTQDVVAAVRFASEHSLLTAVRGGGHSIAGFSSCEGGIVIDLTSMKDVEVDPDARIATAGAGVNWGEFDAATTAHGLATPGGFVPSTGIAGLTLNGGYGFLARQHGLTCDNLIAAEVVTADGTVLRTSETEEPELLWGLRGGGGNFGIVTSFTYRIHPVTDICGGVIYYPADRCADALEVYRSLSSSLPDHAGCVFVSTRLIANPMLPEEIHGQQVVGLLPWLFGDMDELAVEFAATQSLGEPLFRFEGQLPYQVVQSLGEASYPYGEERHYWKSGFVTEISRELVDAVAEIGADPQAGFIMDILPLGAAIGRVPEDATAFAHREARHILSVSTTWTDQSEDELMVERCRATFEPLKKHLSVGVYLNYITDEGEETVKKTYGAKYERLQRLKDKYDPTNLFSMNQNIQPSLRA